MKIIIKKRNILKLLIVLISLLIGLDIVSIYLRFSYSYDESHLKTLINLFDVDMEQNIPTFYSSFQLVLASGLLLVIAKTSRLLDKSFWPWYGLSAIFLFLSIDEFVSLHEHLTNITRNLLHTSGYFYYAWVIPYTVALFTLLAVYFRFLLKLPKRSLILFVASGILFVTGAIGFELLGGHEDQINGDGTFIYVFDALFEEGLEMIGIALFIYALLDYIENTYEKLSISFGNS